jgi:hypothetical protein
MPHRRRKVVSSTTTCTSTKTKALAAAPTGGLAPTQLAPRSHQTSYLLSHETFGNGAQASYVYDLRRKWITNIETTVGGQQAQVLEYTHYDNGQVHQRSALAMPPREYIYDHLNRLEQTVDHTAHTAPSVGGYSYDTIGNIAGRLGADIIYNPNRQHQVDIVDDNNYHYDLAGNVEYSADEERLIRRDPVPGTTLYSVSDLYQRKLDDTGATLEERFRLYADDRQIGEIVRTAAPIKPSSSIRTTWGRWTRSATALATHATRARLLAPRQFRPAAHNPRRELSPPPVSFLDQPNHHGQFCDKRPRLAPPGPLNPEPGRKVRTCATLGAQRLQGNGEAQ